MNTFVIFPTFIMDLSEIHQGHFLNELRVSFKGLTQTGGLFLSVLKYIFIFGLLLSNISSKCLNNIMDWTSAKVISTQFLYCKTLQLLFYRNIVWREKIIKCDLYLM